MNVQYTHLRDRIDQYVGPEITDFADLRKQYGTGRSYLISSNPEKRYGYRIGVQTRIGDIEQSEWIRLVEELIEWRGEQKLFEWLLAWVASNYAWVRCSAEARIYALELHAARVFDDEGWCDYVAFNAVHRPEGLREKQRRMFEQVR